MLTDTKLRKLKAADKTYKETDSNGLYVEVRKTGKKFFRFRYRHPQTRKEQVLTLGEYPALGLAQARTLRDQAKEALAIGQDPSEQKQQTKAEQKTIEQESTRLANRMTFAQLYNAWLNHMAESWQYSTLKKNRGRIEGHLIPRLGDYPLEEITPEIARDALKGIEATGKLETLRKVKQFATNIFQYGVGMGHCLRNPVRDLPNNIFKKVKRENFHNLTDSKSLNRLLNDVAQYNGDISTRVALEVQAYIFLRPTELAELEWQFVELDKGQITIPAESMKMDRPHVVPISKQVKRLLEQQQQYSGHGRYVFPSPHNMGKPLSSQTLNAALHRMGYRGKHTAHGFRGTASTLLNEMGFNSDWIEKQLAHEEGNKVRASYNKAEYLPERAKMLQVWADYLDSIKAGADVVPLHGRLKG